MLQPLSKPSFQWPQALTLEPYRNLKMHQIQKVALVAIGCLLFFGLQCGYALSLCIGIAFTCSVITLLSEAFLRKDDPNNPNWLNRDFDTTELIHFVAMRLLLLPVLLGLITAFGMTPFQGAAIEMMKGNLKIILLSTMIAPIAEEILFRGFFQERLEDLMTFAEQRIGTISQEIKEYVPMCLQALTFGAAHITGNQVLEKGMKKFILLGTTFFGFLCTTGKKEDKSLLTPIAMHASQNTGLTLGLLSGSFIRRNLLKPNIG